MLSSNITSISDQKQSMLDLLYTFCSINSGTHHLAGLARMSEVLKKAFSSLTTFTQTIPLEPALTFDMSGNQTIIPVHDALLIRIRPTLTRRVLMVGHMDTVYPETSPFQTIKQINEKTLNGPGVSDMKGGLVVMKYALEAFEQDPLAKSLGVDILINTDEETGSLASIPLLNTYARKAQAALVYEPAIDLAGTCAKNRKGIIKYTLIVTGRAAHAGRAFKEGRNAICYMASIIQSIDALNHTKDGITLNIGKIAGGDALNVVPDKAIIKLEVRFKENADKAWIQNHLLQIVQQFNTPDYPIILHEDGHRPAKTISQQTIRLFEKIQQAAKELGLPMAWKDTGGCCDGNHLSEFIPVIDTLGVRGGNIHSHDEFIMIDSLVERAQLSALLLKELAQGGLEELYR